VRVAGALLLLGLVALPPRAARAEPWGGITPGQTERREVQALYGPPSRERMVVEEGRTTPEWTYAGDRAPRGIERMVINFGLIRPSGFVPDVVRSVTLYPRPRMFRAQAIANGWGTPDKVGTEEQSGRPALDYSRLGLFIIMDRSGEWAELMLFGPTPTGAKP
jgi:hypothetical protein